MLAASALVALTLMIVAFVLFSRSQRKLLVQKNGALGGDRPALTGRPPEMRDADVIAPDAASRIGMFCEQLRGGGIDAASLARFRRELLDSEPRATIAAIRAFLATGEDAQTGQRFSIAPGGGELDGAPAFRVWLLDILGVLDRTAGTGEAASVARGILEVKTSAAEWALALRNVAWGEPQAGPFLVAKFREMITFEPWLAAPSAGLLEAFDVAVLARDPSLLPLLGGLVQGDRRELQRAAAMALDRMAEADPVPVMTYLNSHPDAFAQRPLLRADYFAKADLSQPPQRAALEMYLARPDVELPEKTKLVKALAAPASFVADTLFATWAPPADDTARFTALERTVGEWISGRRFPELAPALAELQQRLQDR